jgi:hypothetical protein
MDTGDVSPISLRNDQSKQNTYSIGIFNKDVWAMMSICVFSENGEIKKEQTG